MTGTNSKTRIWAILLALVLLLSLGSIAYAQEEIISPSFKIVTPTVNSGTEVSSSTSYSFYTSLGEITDPKLSSPSYSMSAGTPNTFIANVPEITCFETNTNSGSSLCNSSYPNLDGTRGEVGEGGFYDRAKFVIDTQNNPSDTLYGIQISTDNFVTIQYIDGVTRQPITSKSILNFLTKSQWESSPWNSANIIGLVPNTSYRIRITALSGDLTESAPSPAIEATTTGPSITFDLDIGGSSWPNSEESSAPYLVDLGRLTVDMVITAASRIYVDIGSNAINGINISVSDLYNGLYSASASTTIPSPTSGNPASTDLASVSTGYGIRVSNVNTTTPSSLVRALNYFDAGTPELAGRVKSVGSDTVMTTSTGINTGRAQIEVKAKATLSTPASDYIDTITFTAAANL